MRRSVPAAANHSQARVEETARSLHNRSQFPHVQPHPLAARAHVDLHRVACLRRQLLATLRAMHPVQFLQARLFRLRLRLLLLLQPRQPGLQFVHPDVFVFGLGMFHSYNCLLSSLATPLPSTFSTEFSPPNGLGFVSLASGSGIHSPSATIRYSYTPGRKVSSFIQRPSPNPTIGVASGRQSLKVPATQTAAAVGSVYSMRTAVDDDPLRLHCFALFFFISFSFKFRG